MKRFMIKYTFSQGSEDDWRREIDRFIAALDSHPDLRGRVSYRCMKVSGRPDYMNIASVMDEAASKLLNSQEFFSHYTAGVKRVSGGTVEVLPLEILGETEFQPKAAVSKAA